MLSFQRRKSLSIEIRKGEGEVMKKIQSDEERR
jgi:hypothetical protein